MYDNENSFRWRSEQRSAGKLNEDFNDVEVVTLNTKGYLLNALMERDIKSIKRLGPLNSDELDYIISVNSCFLPILYLTKMLSYDRYTSSQLLQVAKKCIELGEEKVFSVIGDRLEIGHKKQLIQHALMVDPNILSFFSFDLELMPLHSPPLTMVQNSSASIRDLLRLWLNSEFWHGSIGKYLAKNQEDLITGDSTREKYIRDELTVVRSSKEIVELLRLSDKGYYFRSTPELRLRSVSVEKAIYYNKKTEDEIEVPMCPCSLESIIKFHPRAKLVNNKEVYRMLLRYSRLEALEELYLSGHSFNQLSIDFDLNVYSYKYLIDRVKMKDAWMLHRGCRSLVNMFVKHYPRMMVDEEDIKTFPHHCMDLMREEVRNKMVRSGHYHALVSRALKDGNTYPYRLLPSKDRSHFRLEVLFSGDLGLAKDFTYSLDEIKINIKKLKAHVIAYYYPILRETVSTNIKMLRSKGDYYVSLYLDELEM